MAELAVPAERGHLDLRLRAVERIAEQASLEVRGTVRHETVLRKIGAATYPRVEVRAHGRTARLGVDVAVAWPAAVGDVAAQVRERVHARTGQLSGLDVSTVDVRVHLIDTEIEERRVR